MPEARYDGAAAWYDRLAGEFMRPFARALAARAAGYAERGDVVLDVGCGTGLGFDALRARGASTPSASTCLRISSPSHGDGPRAWSAPTLPPSR
jgi:hypothetical protein